MTTLWNPKKPLTQPPHFRRIENRPISSPADAVAIAHKAAKFDRKEHMQRQGLRGVAA